MFPARFRSRRAFCPKEQPVHIEVLDPVEGNKFYATNPKNFPPSPVAIVSYFWESVVNKKNSHFSLKVVPSLLRRPSLL